MRTPRTSRTWHGALLIAILLARRSEGQNNCLDCHLELEDDLLTPSATAWSNDVHAAAGLTCASCHGGDPEVNVDDGDYERAMDPAKGYIGVPERLQIPVMCGRCHSNASTMRRYDPNLPVDQEAQYRTSVHGERLSKGDQKVAECASCHRAHGVLAAKDPSSPVYPTRIPETCGKCHGDAQYMSEYGIPTTQLEEYRASVHGEALLARGDLGAPSCSSCHGNHGAAPPGLDSVSRVCGTCHAMQRDLFAASPHQEAFQALELPECETCHDNHLVKSPVDEMVGTEDGAICLECHTEGEDAYAIAASMRDRIETLKAAEAGAGELIARASRAGMEVSDGELLLIDAHQSLVEARNLVHSFDLAPIEEKVNQGLAITGKAEAMGTAALEDLEFRRWGLGVSLFFVLLMVAGLYLKIRQIERPPEERER
jgi:predicted CXXCH cytochrome family protein